MDLLEWSKFFGMIAMIFIIPVIFQLYILKKEFQTLDKEQIMLDEFAKKWSKRLSLVAIWDITNACFNTRRKKIKMQEVMKNDT